MLYFAHINGEGKLGRKHICQVVFSPIIVDYPIPIHTHKRRTKPDFPPAFNQSHSRFCSKQAAQRRQGDGSYWPSSDFQTHTSF